MKECYFCLVSEEEELLYEVVHKKEGVVEVCKKCCLKEKMPLVEKKEVDWEKVDERRSVRERLAIISERVTPKRVEVSEVRLAPENGELRALVEENFKKEVSLGSESLMDLVDNFHWVIMRKRRSMKLSIEKLAEGIFEPLIAVESLEKGILPRDYLNLVKKVESYLGVKLLKERKIGHEDILVESKVPSGILISELREKVSSIFGKSKEPDFEEPVLESKESLEDFEDYDAFSSDSEEPVLSEEVVDANELDLSKVEEISGVPEEIDSKELEKEKKKDSKDELSDDDISDLIWGK